MEPLNISLNSKLFTRPWHVQLYSQYGTMRDSDMVRRELVGSGIDICSYARQVLWGLFVAAILVVGGGIVVAPIGDFTAWITAGMIHGFVSPGEMAMILILVVIGLLLIATSIGAYIVINKHRTVTERPEPGLIGTAYRSFKDKFCVRLKFQ